MEQQAKYDVTEKEYEVMKQPQVGMFLNEQRFEFAQRIGKMLSASTMLPEHFRNNLGNCLIALNLAERLGIDVFGLMQTSYVVHGRPGFEAKLLIAIFNSRTQLFIPPLRWEFRGNFPKGKDAGCRAYAVDKETREPLYGEWIDWDLVTAEGWEKKTGSKWLTMPGQMYRYRSASFFINAYEPGLKMGIHTVDELQDMIIDVTPATPTLPKPETNGDQPSGAKVYDFKTAEKGESVSDENPKAETTDRPILKPDPPGTKIKEEDQKAVDTKKLEQEEDKIARLLSEIKAARPKAGEGARKAFIDLYRTNRELILSMRGADFDYAKGKWVNSGLSWGADFLEEAPNQAQAETPPVSEAKDQGAEKKTPPASIVDFGEGEEKSEPEGWFMPEATKYKLELAQETWEQILGLYGMKGKDLNTLALGYREAFLARCKAQLEKQNTK